MKVIAANTRKIFKRRNLVVFLMVFVLINIIGYLFDIKYISVFSAIKQVDKYKVRSELLMDAMDYVGVCSPQDAAKVWAEGLRMRSAAMQYSVMTKTLKGRYAKQLNQTFANWVTGMSSPWVNSYEITKSTKNEDGYIFEVKISTLTSTGPEGEYNATLTVVSENGFPRISNITMDKELYAYTGFKPKLII